MDHPTATAYRECLATMFGLQRFGIKLGLRTIGAILDGLGAPHQHFKCIHIAGTNGKGSVAAMLAQILQQAGYRVGLYTSPHLVRFNERIRIDGVPISDDDVLDAYTAIRRIDLPERQPTFFEFTTAMALTAFQRHDVQWAVIETGMGGRLDATNVIHPQLSVITNISLEHREYLGSRLADIAFEKAGIIKPGVPVVTGASQRVVRDTLQAQADARRAPLYRLGADFKVRKAPGQAVHFYGRTNVWRHVPLALFGAHQRANAALALAGCEVLMAAGAVDLDVAAIHRGMAATRWPGRLEIVSEKPMILLDGAHNLAAVAKLAAFIDDALKGRALTLVVGILDDKPYRQMLSILAPRCSHVIVTRPVINRALPPETLRDVAAPLCPRVTVVPTVGEAVVLAKTTTGPEDVICIAGSLYVVGEATEALDFSR
ncbi:MAG: folylpolyglutamate synthase/dihydrofolate synthase family protein [Pseudomonadota bacterium]